MLDHQLNQHEDLVQMQNSKLDDLNSREQQVDELVGTFRLVKTDFTNSVQGVNSKKVRSFFMIFFQNVNNNKMTKLV